MEWKKKKKKKKMNNIYDIQRQRNTNDIEKEAELFKKYKKKPSVKILKVTDTIKENKKDKEERDYIAAPIQSIIYI